jgi:AcrR family transcriptional regulator
VPYSAEHKARSRGRIVESARRLFNRFGFEQVSIDQIMSNAGLTRGGFYNHFESKDQLYAAAVTSYVGCNPFAAKAAKAKPPIVEPRKLARMLVNLYLSDEAFDDVDMHCPLYALPSDVARAGFSSRQAYTDLIRGMVHVYRAALSGARDADRRAQTIASVCVGGMVLARTTNDPALRKSLRAAARHQALALLDA